MIPEVIKVEIGNGVGLYQQKQFYTDGHLFVLLWWLYSNLVFMIIFLFIFQEMKDLSNKTIIFQGNRKSNRKLSQKWILREKEKFSSVRYTKTTKKNIKTTTDYQSSLPVTNPLPVSTAGPNLMLKWQVIIFTGIWFI